MDKADEDDQTTAVAASCGCEAIVPPKTNRREPWTYDRETCKRRNEVARMFGLIKENRNVATRSDKLDATYSSCVYLAFIAVVLRDLA